MVHRMDSVEEFPTQRKLCRKKLKVKSECGDPGSDENGFVSKKRKFDFSNEEKEGEAGELEYDPLEEPSPLGLKLKKSPSFLDLIQMKLSQERRKVSLAKTLAIKEKDSPSSSAAAAADNNNINKLKASNFPASLLKIGTWEYKSRYEGDLVAKCYFAKHKLVWEVLDGGLKNKIEIQWSDIMAINANYPDNEPGTLDVVLGRQPSFFREINPQPRKHTLWQATTDFTCGQASLHRRHYLQFPQGTLGKHFQKLIQCDPRLSFLSQQPQIVLDTPYFQPRVSIFGESDPENDFELKNEGKFSFPGIRDTVSVSGLSTSDIESQNHVGSKMNSQIHYQPTQGVYAMVGDVSSKFNDTRGLELLKQIKLPGLHPSMSVGDLVNHIGDCISEQMRSDNSNLSNDETQKSEVLKEITHYLLSDSHSLTVSDEKSIMSRVNSLCCLLQKEDTGVPTPANRPIEDRTALDLFSVSNNSQEGMNPTYRSCEDRTSKTLPAAGSELGLGIDSQQGTSMPRKDSVDELLLNLPRIASLPQFLIPEESGNLAR